MNQSFRRFLFKLQVIQVTFIITFPIDNYKSNHHYVLILILLAGKEKSVQLAGPGCEISNQFLKELIDLKVILSI